MEMQLTLGCSRRHYQCLSGVDISDDSQIVSRKDTPKISKVTQVKGRMSVLARWLDDPNSIPGTHVKEGENRYPKVVL